MSNTTLHARRLGRADGLNPDRRDNAGFDPATHPIIARHFFGIEPSRPIGPVPVEVFTELPAENTAERGSRTIVDQKLDHYAELEPGALDATGGNHSPPMPLHEFCDG